MPLGLINLALAARALPDSDRAPRPLDWTSAGLNALAFGLFFVGADGLTHGGAGLPWALVEVAIALADRGRSAFVAPGE